MAENYTATSPYFNTGYSQFFLDVMVNRPIPKSTDDLLFTITGARLLRSSRFCNMSRRAMAWKVPIVGLPSSSNRARRVRISVAACRVKVMARVFSISAVPDNVLHAMRRVRTVVLPEPAPARTTTMPIGAVTASRC